MRAWSENKNAARNTRSEIFTSDGPNEPSTRCINTCQIVNEHGTWLQRERKKSKACQSFARSRKISKKSISTKFSSFNLTLSKWQSPVAFYKESKNAVAKADCNYSLFRADWNRKIKFPKFLTLYKKFTLHLSYIFRTSL